MSRSIEAMSGCVREGCLEFSHSEILSENGVLCYTLDSGALFLKFIDAKKSPQNLFESGDEGEKLIFFGFENGVFGEF